MLARLVSGSGLRLVASAEHARGQRDDSYQGGDGTQNDVVSDDAEAMPPITPGATRPLA